MSKNFAISADQIEPLAHGRAACMATAMITVEGAKVGYMYREESLDDSGWVFLAGTESQDYLDDPENFEIYDVNTIASYDPGIIPFLDAPAGSAFARNAESGQFEAELPAPRFATSAATGITSVDPELGLTFEAPLNMASADSGSIGVG